MGLQFDSVFESMLSALKLGLSSGGEELLNSGQSILMQRKEKIKEITLLRLDGTLSQEEYESEIEDEKTTFEDQVLAETAELKSIAQQSINKAIDVLLSAVERAL